MGKDLSDLKVCIFDVFGTVVDWRGSLIADLPALGKKYGIETDWTSFADDVTEPTVLRTFPSYSLIR